MNKTIEKLEGYIKLLKEKNQCTRAKSISSKWSDLYEEYPLLKKVINCIKKEKGFNISRDYIFQLTDEKKVLGILLWGYPYGFLGKDNTKEVVKNYSNIHNLLEENKKKVLKEDELIQLYKKMREFGHIGRSTISKLLYFYEFRLKKLELVIVDSRVLTALYAIDEINIGEFIFGNEEECEAKYYIKMCKKINKLANSINVTPSQMEFFLFKLGDFYIKNTRTSIQSLSDFIQEK